jgi:hypothetical protein
MFVELVVPQPKGGGVQPFCARTMVALGSIRHVKDWKNKNLRDLLKWLRYWVADGLRPHT